MPPNPTPHEQAALAIAQKLDRYGGVGGATIRKRIAHNGIPDDAVFRDTMRAAKVSEEQVIATLRRIHGGR